MRFTPSLLLCFALSQQGFALGPARSSQGDRDYVLGAIVGQCILAQCVVFHGSIITAVPLSGEPVVVRLDEVMFGSANTTTVSVPYERFPNDRSGEFSVASAWANVTPTFSAAVTVVLGLGEGLNVHAGLPVLVTSEGREMQVIRTLAGQIKRLQESTEPISDAIASLSREPNPALAGYLVTYLTFGKTSLQEDRKSSLLQELLENPSVPAYQSAFIVPDLVFRYHALSDAGKIALVRRVSSLGQKPDRELAKAGYWGLARLSEIDQSVSKMISAPALDELRKNYSSLVKQGMISRDSVLERGLGIDMQ